MAQFVPCSFKDKKIVMLGDSSNEAPPSFKSLGITEAEIEEFLKKNIGLLTEDSESDKRETLMIVGQQVIDSSNGRSDLVALDGEGNLVLIEIKRDKEDIASRAEPLELQAIRYAAALSGIRTPDMLIDSLFSRYLGKMEKPDTSLTTSEWARRKLHEFMESNKIGQSLNSKQRIVLVASSFDERTLSACSWLIKNGVDITVINIQPLQLPGNLDGLKIERILPPGDLSDYMQMGIKASGKSQSQAASKISRTYLPRMDKLFEWDIVRPGDVVYVSKWPDQKADVISQKTVSYLGKEMSFNAWAQEVTGWQSVCIYDQVKVERHDRLLSELRDEKMQQEANATSNQSCMTHLM